MVPSVPGAVLGVGTDLVEVGRLRDALGRQPGLHDRLFTVAELAYARRHRDPVPHLAARFAAKEAVMKSLGAGMSTMGFIEIEVVRADSGAPSVALSGSAAAHAGSLGVAGWHLSLTHTDSTAHAIAMALAAPMRS
jgi:holo-[acyl-carrier protein] synthase